MKRYFVLLVLLAGILLPMAWFGRFSESYQVVFDFVFGPPWMHVVTHALLFAVLAYLLAVVFSALIGASASGQSRLLLVVIAVFAIALMVALLQEIIQLTYKGRSFGDAEWFDLGVDMIGIGLGLVFSELGRWLKIPRLRSG